MRRPGFATARRATTMSDHLIHDLSVGQIALRVLFSLAVTAFIGVRAYFTISWLAGLHP
jgi:hypothetical protein